MIDADILRAMAAAGASVEVIIAAVEADAAKEMAKREAKRENNAERQRRFKARRKQKTRGNVGNALLSVTPPIEEIIPPVSSDEETTPRSKSKSAKPEGVTDQVWTDFLAHRKAIKAPVSATAIDAISREASKARWTLDAALAECVARGWRGFKAEWVQDSTGPPGSAAGGASFLTHLIEKERQTQHVATA